MLNFAWAKQNEEHFKNFAKKDHSSATADHVKATDHNTKWDHFDILCWLANESSSSVLKCAGIQYLSPLFVLHSYMDTNNLKDFSIKIYIKTKISVKHNMKLKIQIEIKHTLNTWFYRNIRPHGQTINAQKSSNILYEKSHSLNGMPSRQVNKG